MNILIVANDVTPDFGLPVAAPGLRAWSLAHGLRGHGHDVNVVVDDGPLQRAAPGGVPPSARGVTPLDFEHLDAYVHTHQPDAVVFSNSNHVDRLSDDHEAVLVLDFFAPKMLEYGFREHPEGIDLAAMRRLREQQIRAFERADVVAVNGPKKHGYVLAWLLQSDRDPRVVPIVQVPFGVPPIEPERHGGGLRLAVTGYVQAWSGAGEWLDPLLTAMDDVDVEVHLVLGRHWGGGTSGDELGGGYERLLAHKAAVRHDPMPFDEFRQMLAGVDATIDLFDHHYEREYAMVTRTLVALCSGAAVIHPDYTEVGDLVAEYDAGWLLDRHGDVDLVRLCKDLAADPDEVFLRRRNAARLARERLDPVVATAALSRAVEEAAS